MLEDLDATLETLIKREFSSDVPSASTEVHISFETPFQGAIAQKPALNFFLYDVRENLELRNAVGTWERQGDGKAIKRRPPARIDCSYLVTAWPQNDEDIKTEHQLLGELMRVLLRFRQIPEVFWQDSLQDQPVLIRMISLRSSNLNSFGEFWQAMGGRDGTRPKVVLHCTVTIAVDIDDEPLEAPLTGLVAGGVN
jgi:hypothetical protein